VSLTLRYPGIIQTNIGTGYSTSLAIKLEYIFNGLRYPSSTGPFYTTGDSTTDDIILLNKDNPKNFDKDNACGLVEDGKFMLKIYVPYRYYYSYISDPD
jgi:hypothetical protein